MGLFRPPQRDDAGRAARRCAAAQPQGAPGAAVPASALGNPPGAPGAALPGHPGVHRPRLRLRLLHGRHPQSQDAAPEGAPAGGAHPGARRRAAGRARQRAKPTRRSTCCRSTCSMRWSPPRTGASSSTGASTRSGWRGPPSPTCGSGRFAQGGSTLTQQLAKNLFLSSKRTLSRKLEELILALWLEVRLSKRDILEIYLNRVYFGGGAYGVETAAQRFFGKPARDLTLAEAAVLAGLLKAPSKFSPASNPAHGARASAQRARQDGGGGRSQPSEEEDGRARCPSASPTACSQREQSGVEYAVDAVLERLPPLASAEGRELIVETTIDARAAAARPGDRARPDGRRGPHRRRQPGGARAARHAGRHARAGRRPLLRRQPVQPRPEGQAAAGLRVQDRSSIWRRWRAACGPTASSRTCRSSAPAGARATRAASIAATSRCAMRWPCR